jgi:RHS repeat-associated protein
MASPDHQEVFVPHASQNADNQLTLWGSQGFLYDLNGNMTADGNNGYAWNVRNQLVALTPDGGTADTFVYDAFGRRQKKVINGTETDFLFDQDGNLAAELTDGGEYFTSTDLEGFSPDELVCRYTAGADGGLNQPLMAMTDINGSVLGLVADGGAIQATYAYEPYGNVSASGTDNGNSQQFTARENDGTGVYYYRARYFMPGTGRFTSEDPIGFPGGVNLYQYAAANPIQHADPSGNSTTNAPVGPFFIGPGGMCTPISCSAKCAATSLICFAGLAVVAPEAAQLPSRLNCALIESLCLKHCHD